MSKSAADFHCVCFNDIAPLKQPKSREGLTSCDFSCLKTECVLDRHSLEKKVAVLILWKFNGARCLNILHFVLELEM